MWMSDSAGPAAGPVIRPRRLPVIRPRRSKRPRLDDAGNVDERDNGHNFTESSPPIGFWDSIRADLTHILRELDAEKSVQNDLLTHLRKLEQQQESAQSDSEKWQNTVERWNIELHRKVNKLLRTTDNSAGAITTAVNNQQQIYGLVENLYQMIIADSRPPRYTPGNFRRSGEDAPPDRAPSARRPRAV